MRGRHVHIIITTATITIELWVVICSNVVNRGKKRQKFYSFSSEIATSKFFSTKVARNKGVKPQTAFNPYKQNRLVVANVLVQPKKRLKGVKFDSFFFFLTKILSIKCLFSPFFFAVVVNKNTILITSRYFRSGENETNLQFIFHFTVRVHIVRKEPCLCEVKRKNGIRLVE